MRGVAEVVDGGTNLAREAEDGLQAAPLMSPEQFEGVVAAIVDDEVGGGQGFQMGEGSGALVAVGEEVEIDREAGLQPEQAAEQASGVVGLRAGGAVIGLGQLAGRVSLEPSTAKTRWPCQRVAERSARPRSSAWNCLKTRSWMRGRALHMAASETGWGWGRGTSMGAALAHNWASVVV